MSRKEKRREWIEALRSGKYEQTQNYLRSGNSFCCLGVLCDISGIDKWDESFINHIPYGKNTVMPTSDVTKLVNLSDRRARLLTLANDSGKTFNEIADIIESWKN